MDLDPFSHEFHEDPYPVYRWLRDNEPCYRNDALGFFALSRHADVLEASQQPLLYSSAEGTTLEKLDTQALLPMMIFMDPPDHDVQRKLVSRAFTPRAIAELEPFVRATAVECLAPLLEQGGGDFVEEFSAILPMNVIMELLGVPNADRNTLRHLMDATLDRLEAPPYIPDHAIEAMAKTGEYWAALLAEKRAHPDDGFVSKLCSAEIDADDGAPTRLTDREVIGFASLIGSAGTETLTKLLANAAVLFHRHPGEWRKVLDDPSTIPGAVEETLRYWPPSQYQGRVLTDDVTADGVEMPKGSRVLLLTAAATRDDREYDDADRFVIDRTTHVALGFGYGLHFCLGAALARLEGRIGLAEFGVRHFPRYEIDETKLRRVHMSNVHGFASVPFAAA